MLCMLRLEYAMHKGEQANLTAYFNHFYSTFYFDQNIMYFETNMSVDMTLINQ